MPMQVFTGLPRRSTQTRVDSATNAAGLQRTQPWLPLGEKPDSFYSDVQKRLRELEDRIDALEDDLREEEKENVELEEDLRAWSVKMEAARVVCQDGD